MARGADLWLMTDTVSAPCRRRVGAEYRDRNYSVLKTHKRNYKKIMSFTWLISQCLELGEGGPEDVEVFVTPKM